MEGCFKELSGYSCTDMSLPVRRQGNQGGEEGEENGVFGVFWGIGGEGVVQGTGMMCCC